MITSTCSSCGAPIIWCVTAGSGKFMPVDAEPVDGGNVTLAVPTDSRAKPLATVHGQAPLGATSLYLSHFVTCPQAGEWRKR